ncbi:MAG: hypothetical protein OXC46_04635 [Thaumarchaeota archaeon]|nr:hypothetical protein [Nitrososphaerota archaeon]
MKSIIILVFTVFFVTVGINETYGQTNIPDWVKNVAGFWANGDISDQEYAASISYLAENNIITIPQPEPKELTCDEINNNAIQDSFTFTGIMYTFSINPTPELNSYIDTIGEKVSNSLDIYNNSDCHYTDKQQNINDIIIVAVNQIQESLESGSCSLFCDSTGYEPTWAKSMGTSQATSKCLTIDDYESKDADWCLEFHGWKTDQLR